MTDGLIEYAARVTLQSPKYLADAIASDRPQFVDADYLEADLLAHWPALPAEARLLAVLLAHNIATESASNEDRY